MTKGIPAFFLLFICAAIFLSGCQNASDAPKDEAVTVFQMTASQNHVAEFLEKAENLLEDFGEDTCCNVTPPEITEQYGFEIFKFVQSGAGYLLYEDAVYPLGAWFGGCGAVGFAAADLNLDGAAELYFTYSFGSGLHRSMAGYFDSALSEVISFDYQNPDHDMVFVSENGRLLVFNAELKISSFVDIRAKEAEKIGEIVLESKEITLKIEEVPR